MFTWIRKLLRGAGVSISETRLRITRDGVMFTTGLLGVVHETVISGIERPALLLMFGGMMGLPAFLHKDEKEQAKQHQEKDRDEDDEQSSRT